MFQYVTDMQQLNKPCKPCRTLHDGLQLGQRLLHVLERSNDGVGLAANQIGIDSRVCVVKVTKPIILINPEIIGKFGKSFFQEGCLSLPGIALDVERPEKVVLKYQTMDQEWHEDEFEGLLSRAIQHEMDHLNGIFIVDRVSNIEKIKYKNELKKLLADSKYSQKNKNKENFVL